MRPDFGRFFSAWEYKQCLLTTHLPNVSSLIISRDVLAVFLFCYHREKSDNSDSKKHFHYLDFRNGQKKIKPLEKVPAQGDSSPKKNSA